MAGRPSKYRPEFVDQARKLAAAGFINEGIAAFFDVTRRTFDNWLVVHEDFAQAVYDGRQKANASVEEALFHRAVGYSHPDEEIRVLRNGEIVRVPTVKRYPPDPTAAIWWLKNRDPANWRDRPDPIDPDAVVEPVRVELVVASARKKNNGETE